MPTAAELKATIDTDITNKTEPLSLGNEELGNDMKAIVDFAEAKTPWMIYDINLTQTGTSSPTVVEKSNNLGYTPTIGYVGVGVIGILMTGLDLDKTKVIISPKSASSKLLVPSYYITGSTIFVKTYNLLTSAFENDMLVKTPLKIEVYP